MQFLKLNKRNKINFLFINLIVKFYANVVPIICIKQEIIRIKHLKQLKIL